MKWTARNEGEAHPMSPEKGRTAQPSPCKLGEGSQGWTQANPVENWKGLNDNRSNYRRGGVSEHGMFGRLRVLSGEISSGGHRPNARHNSVQAEKAGAARREVGSVRSSDESRNEAGAKGPNLVEVNSEATDEAMAPSVGILTPLKVQAFQRTLCRSAKWATSIAPAVNDHGKPDAVNPPVRFDEGRGVQRRTDNTGRLNHLLHSLPTLLRLGWERMRVYPAMART